MTECTVCQNCSENINELSCQHVFCNDCFDQFIAGSIVELRFFLRCCVCGTRTILVKESKNECPILNFGREGVEVLQKPLSLASNGNCLTISDKETSRVTVWKDGALLNSFPIIHRSNFCHGISVANDRITVAVAENQFTAICSYTFCGKFMMATYLSSSVYVTTIQHIQNHEIMIGDAEGRLYVIGKSGKVKTEKQLENCNYIGGLTKLITDEIAITNTPKHTIQFYDDQLEYLTATGGYGQRAEQFNFPTSIDSCHNIIAVADTGNKRVQLLDKRGNFIRFLVRYVDTVDVFMQPIGVTFIQECIAVMLGGVNRTKAGEVRIYQL
ncbi:DgyrCDS149 [Dimorphilus gyrociliatus]|uniref:DgyrCDS149 n=1 Tax=Dimorphilus gyrociliatus TaxID=2664684 RepID=A0A7I8V401_9ANNE|nr:DgyrCDS149 [Dimorphilus gyrociliatus]